MLIKGILKRVLLAVFVLSQVPVMAQISFGDPVKINENWKFKLQDNTAFKTASFKDKDWNTVDLPHDWSVKGQLDSTLASATGYLPGGVAWYRKTIDIPKSKKGEKVFLYFEGVYNRSEVFLNGKSLGKRPNGYISFAYDATEAVNYGGKNTIAVRVDHSQSADSRWYTGSGIYRNVWLVYANPIHIGQWGVFAYPEMDGDSGTLQVEVNLENETSKQETVTVLNQLVNAAGTVVASDSQEIPIDKEASAKVNASLKLTNPELWNLEHPYLYTLKTTVSTQGKTIDQTSTKTGFRTFTFDADKGFALNGEWMKMKGVCLHHDAGVLGSAVPREVWETRLKTLKDIGVNAIRTSHNPQSPDFYDLCDSLGILVLNEAYDEWEFPKRKWLQGWNVGTPGYQGSYDIFKTWSEQDLADMVRRDRNHLSVFAWSIGNEVDYPNDPYSHPVLAGGGDTGFSQAVYGGYKKDAPDAMRLGAIAKRLVATVKQYDTTRPTTAGLAGVAMSNFTEYPGALDITGYNYTESKYLSDHEKYPNRVIYGSETRHDYDAWKAVVDNDHIFGQFLWTGIDYLGESREWPSRGFYSGLVDFMGRIKPMGYFRQSLWSDKPMIYIGTHPSTEKSGNEYYSDSWSNWNYNAGQEIRVVCYTNAAKARLELNGKVVGETLPYNEKTGFMSWDIPFQSGILVAVGLNAANQEVSRYTIKTAGQPEALTAKVNTSALDQNHDVTQIILGVTDKDQNLVLASENEVTCEISGPGELLGMEAGNNSDMGDYTDNKQKVYKGEMSVYIKTTEKGKPVTVKFTSPGLKSVEITL
ncbi:sugar-binding domain-containing protein [Formosa sp. S-31]|uniref:sugar-binding domain-containing protein n=1 Tax=Formosa sp. S-31 TaxID=2790949 RepID=UPI003EBB2140